MNHIRKLAIIGMLALILGSTLVIAGPAMSTLAAANNVPVAACTSGVDVGLTILQGGFVKGSGSYNNCSGQLAKVCVDLYYQWGYVAGRCVATPQGPGFAFSAPDQRCAPGDWYTLVTGTRPNGSIFQAKGSNVLHVSQC